MTTRRLAGLLVALGLGVFTTPARALPPRLHRDIALRTCTDAGLPRDFCRRVGVADFDVDANEWDDMAAHAQIASGGTACGSANATAQRMAALGRDAAGRIDELGRSSSLEARDALAVLLGRALHTVQDECAHRGMPNTQHAWRSLSDVCDGTRSSPDVQPEAAECATRDSAAVMALVAGAVRAIDLSSRALADNICAEPDRGEGGGGQQRGPCDDVYLPAPWDACSFLSEAEVWDGTDLRWRHDVVGAALREAFGAGLSGIEAPVVCAQGNDSAILDAPGPAQDVAGGPPSCGRIHVLCFGKADGSGGVDLHDVADAPAGDEGAQPAAACTIVAGRSPTAAAGSGFAVLLAFVLLARRQPFSRRAPDC